MSEVVKLLFPCPVKGCPWRGEAAQTCPMHPEEAWEEQSKLLPDHVVARYQTRHRS